MVSGDGHEFGKGLGSGPGGRPEPAPPEGVAIDELEAMVRRVVAEELQPVKDALARPGAAASSPLPGGAPNNLMRMRQRRLRR